MYPSGHLFFHSEIQNFTVVPKRPFVFLQRNTKFRIAPKWPFVFLTKQNILKFVPKRPFVFQNKRENFESCTQMAKLYFSQGNTKSNYI